MAGLAGFQYPGGNQGNASGSAAFLNPSHYPAYAAAQYNAAMAAGYWPAAAGQVGNASGQAISGSTSVSDRSASSNAGVGGDKGNNTAISKVQQPQI
jgi:hypothetical protein